MHKHGIAAVVLGLAAGAASAALTNGSFESVALGVGNDAFLTDGDSASITGWTVVVPAGGDVQWLDQDAYQGIGFTLTASDGRQWVNLAGSDARFDKGLTQTFAGAAGAHYTLWFDIGRLADRGDAYVSVTVNGSNTVLGNTQGAGSGSEMRWTTVSFDFIGLASNTVTFSGDGNGDNTMIGLDHVVLTVPEPNRYAMLLAGVCAVLLISRRRRR